MLLFRVILVVFKNVLVMLLFVVILVTFQIVVVMLLFMVILVVHTSDRCGDVGRLEDCCYVAGPCAAGIA